MMKKIVMAGVFIMCLAVVMAALSQEQQAAPAEAVTSSLIIEEGVVCTEVADRVPQGAGETFAPDVGKLYCFTKISGAAGETTIKHLWYFGEELLHTQELKLGGSPWRTWSSKTITPDRTGAWKVDIQDADGNLITTLNFSIQQPV